MIAVFSLNYSRQLIPMLTKFLASPIYLLLTNIPTEIFCQDENELEMSLPPANLN